MTGKVVNQIPFLLYLILLSLLSIHRGGFGLQIYKDSFLVNPSTNSYHTPLPILLLDKPIEKSKGPSKAESFVQASALNRSNETDLLQICGPHTALYPDFIICSLYQKAFFLWNNLFRGSGEV